MHLTCCKTENEEEKVGEDKSSPLTNTCSRQCDGSIKSPTDGEESSKFLRRC